MKDFLNENEQLIFNIAWGVYLPGIVSCAVGIIISCAGLALFGISLTLLWLVAHVILLINNYS